MIRHTRKIIREVEEIYKVNGTIMRTRIISAFPGTGKSFYHSYNKETTLDSDSSLFSWIYVDGLTYSHG